MPITLTTGFILLFSFSIFLILFFSDSEKPDSPDSQCNFLLHQVLGCDQPPVAALWGCPSYPALLCPFQPGHPAPPHTYCFPALPQSQQMAFGLNCLGKGKENHFLIHI